MLLSKERCFRCRSEMAVRKCPRYKDKLIGWKCCMNLRIDLHCPSSCPYAAQFDESHTSPFPAFRSDSNTEFVQTTKKFLDFWCYKSLPELDGLSPAEFTRQDSEKMLKWLEQYKYPANFPLSYLMQKLNIPYEEIAEPESPETVTFAFFDAVITQEWEKLRSFTINDVDFDQFAERYTAILSSIPELKKTKSYSILYAGAADDGISAMVVLELNNKIIWAVLLTSATGRWKIRQNFNGGPHLFYEQNQLFQNLADALANGRAEEAWNLLTSNMPKFPDCADLYYYRALYWQLAKQYNKAKEDFWNALALDNHFFAAGFALSTLYLHNSELEQARDLLNFLHQEKPDELNAWNNLAACEAGLGNLELAKNMWQEILQIAPNYEPAKKNLEKYSN